MPGTSTEAVAGDVRSAVVDAAVGLLREGGHRSVTTRAVALAAGVQAPTIYRLFGDKDGLMAAVAERVMADYVTQEAADLASGSGDPVEGLRSAWDIHVAFGLANPDLYGLLVQPDQLSRSAATTAGIDVLTGRVTRVAATGRLRVPVTQAVRMIHAAGTGVVLTLLNDPPAVRDQTLSRATLDAVLASLLTDEPVPDRGDHVGLALALAVTLPAQCGLSEAEQGVLGEWLERIARHAEGS